MSAPFTGECACGAIRYEVTARPIAMFNCHCRDCQRTTGGAFTPVVYVPAKAFKITKGSPKYYSTPSEMVGHNKRGFCPDCGSRLFGGETGTRPRHYRFQPGRSELVQTESEHVDFRSPAVGSHGSELAEV
jgi:hypothetical protein